MTIDSVSFIFWLLPIFLLLFACFKEKLRKPLILCISLFICSWGSLKSLLLLLAFIVCNWAFGLLISYRRNAVYVAVCFDVVFLFVLKYFCIDGIAPFGISYYALSGISYCVDIYRMDVSPCQSLYNTAFYLAFFPKLCMGPFVKYKDFASQIDHPFVHPRNVSDGLWVFSIGLAKKLAIAGSLAEVASKCIEDSPYSTCSAWLGLICSVLQLYFDFSGYSDMASGLSAVCGFEIDENFNHPFESSSLRELWSRWHISLGSWFKDYVYISLGGNRCDKKRAVLNLFIVWMLTALWHGVSLTFIAWGLFCFAFVYLEKLCNPWLSKLPKFFRIITTDLIFLLALVFFISSSLEQSFKFFGYLFGQSEATTDAIFNLYFNKYWMLVVAAIIGSTSIPCKCASKIFNEDKPITVVFQCIFVIALLSVSTASIVINGYTPFLYAGF